MDQVLKCPSCSEQYDRTTRLPLVLICGHTLCKECAQVSRVCPIDQKEDPRSLPQISHSYHLLDLVEQISSMHQTIKYLQLNPQQRFDAMREQVELAMQQGAYGLSSGLIYLPGRFASTEEGNRLTPEQQRAKLELVVKVADEVWGSS